MKLIGFVFYEMSLNDKKLFMVDELKNSDFEFVIYDLSYLIKKKVLNSQYADSYLTSFEDFINVVNKNKNFIIYFGATYKLKPFFDVFLKYKNKNYIEIRNGKLGISRKKNNLFTKIKRLLNSESRCNYIYKKMNNTNITNILFESGQTNGGVEIPSFEYDEYLKIKKQNSKFKEKYHLFLDQNLPHHRDLKEILNKEFKGAENYYKKLRAFFDTIEKETGKKVKVAIHPRSESSKYDFGDREVVKDKTCELVANADIVFAHFSTSIHYPIIFNKKLVLITMYEINRLGLLSSIDNFSDLLSIPILNIDNSKNYYLEEYINKNNYTEYIYKYIVSKKCIESQRVFWKK